MAFTDIFRNIVKGSPGYQRGLQAGRKQRLSSLAEVYGETQDPATLSQIAALDPQRAAAIQGFQAQQLEEKSISDYLQDPSQQNLSMLAARAPKAAASVQAQHKAFQTSQAKKVRSIYNTWQRTPISQKGTLYEKWRKENQEDMEDFPIEYNEQTAPQINSLLERENFEAMQMLGEQPLSPEGKKGFDVQRGYLEAGTQTKAPVSPQGKLLLDVQRGLVPASVASRKLRSEEPILAGREIGQIENLSDRADALEDIAEQNIAQGNTRVGTQQARKARTLRKEFRKDQELIEKNTQKLSSTLDKSGIVDLVGSLESITSIINANPEDIPGMGKGAAIPAFALSTEGKILRQSVATLRNSILKARSGGAVTPQEASRLLEELGSGAGKTDKQLRIGIGKVIKRFQDTLQNIKGGFRQEAVEKLAERSGGDIFGRINALSINTGGKQAPSGTVSGIKWRVK